MVEATEPEVGSDTGWLAGPVRANYSAEAEKFKGIFSTDNHHYPMGTGRLLAMGLKGIADAGRKNAGAASDDVRARNLLSISRSYDRVRTYVEKHAALAGATAAAGDEQARERLMTVARNCAALAAGPPSTFHQAIQLFWFALPLRNRAGSSTLGSVCTCSRVQTEGGGRARGGR